MSPTLLRPKGLRRAVAALVRVSLIVLALSTPLWAEEAPDQLVWRNMIQRIAQGLDIRAEGLNATRVETSILLQTLRTELTKSNNRFHQVQLLRNVSGDTPWAVRTILLHLQDVYDDLSLKTQPLTEQKDELVRSRGDDATFLEIQADIAAADPNAFELAELDPTLNRLKAIRAEEENVLRDADAGLSSASRLLERIKAARETARERVISVLASYYFEACPSLLTASGRETARAEMRSWANDFPQFFKTVARWIRWDEVLGYTAPCFVLLYWVLPGLWRRSRRREKTRSPWRFSPGWFLFSLGLAASVALRFGLFTLNQFTNLGAVMVLTLGLVLILEDKRGATAAGLSLWRSSPLFTLWLLFAAGALVLAAEIPPSALGLYSTVSCALAAWCLQASKSQEDRERRTTVRGLSAGILTVFALVAPFGFGPQTLALSQGLFMLLLTLDIMRAFKRHLYGVETVADDFQESSRVSTMAYPLVATILAFLYVLWVFMFIGGPGFLEHMLEKKWTLGSMSLGIESLGMILTLFFGLRLALAWIKLVTANARFRGGKLNSAMAHTVNATVSYAAWTVFALVSIHLLGVSLSSLTWIASGLSVGVGFGLKDIVNNFISGLIILFGGAIKKGDIIQQGKNLGEVIDVSVRNTTIRTQENTMVIIPNSTFLRGEIINLSYQDAKTRLTIPVTVVPGTKVKKVIKILLDVAKKSGNVMKNPQPEASLVRFGKMGLEFELYVWIENFLEKFDTEAQLVTKIDSRFQEEKVMLAFQGVKVKYKPKGNEEQQLESQREQLRTKRKEVFSRVRPLRSVYSRLRWNVSTAAARATDE